MFLHCRSAHTKREAGLRTHTHPPLHPSSQPPTSPISSPAHLLADDAHAAVAVLPRGAARAPLRQDLSIGTPPGGGPRALSHLYKVHVVRGVLNSAVRRTDLTHRPALRSAPAAQLQGAAACEECGERERECVCVSACVRTRACTSTSLEITSSVACGQRQMPVAWPWKRKVNMFVSMFLTQAHAGLARVSWCDKQLRMC
eukprot:589430-Pelagomonas_calceolata.AAC.3